MGRDIVTFSLVICISFAQIIASAQPPNDDHQAESVTKASRPVIVAKHREHRSRSRAKDDETEKPKPPDFGMANAGHWEWVPDAVPRNNNNAYVFQPPAVGAAMYPYYPMPMWPALLPSAPPQVSSTAQPQSRASDSHMRAHQRPHGNDKKNEPTSHKHTQSEPHHHHHKPSESEKSGVQSHGRNKKDGNANPRRSHSTNHHKTTEGSKIPDSGRDQHREGLTVTEFSTHHEHLPGSVSKNDKSANDKLRMPSQQTDSGSGNKGGGAGSIPAQTIGNAKSEPEQKQPRKLSTNH